MIYNGTHIDLDGIGCSLALSEQFDVTSVAYNYDGVTEYLNMMQETFIRDTRYTKVFITDLRYTEENMRHLREISDSHPEKEFIFIDHHEYDYDYKQYSTDNLKIFVSQKYCATYLTYKYLERNYGTKFQSTKFYDTIDAYDMWREDSNLFKMGVSLNDLFWSYTRTRFYSKFKGNKKLSLRDKEAVKDIIQKKDNLFAKYIKLGRIFTDEDKKLLVTYLDDYRSHITLDFKGYLVYLNISSYGSISIRISNLVVDEKVNQMFDIITNTLNAHENIISAGGHKRAIGARMSYVLPETLITMGGELAVLLDRLIND